MEKRLDKDMIACNYTTHLYCEICNEMEEFIGTSQTGTFRDARKAGWKISADKTKAWCPEHKSTRKKRKLKKTKYHYFFS